MTSPAPPTALVGAANRRNRRHLWATAYAISSLLAAFLFAVIVTAGATRWLPEGRAGVDHIILPILFFPLVWMAMALGLYAAPRRRRAWAIAGTVTAVHLAAAASGFLMGSGA
jgi:hypothetical protein